MKITKYPQSCILVETKGKKILIDPGTYVYEQTDIKPEDFKDIDVISVTHKHSDHCFPEALKIIKENNLQDKCDRRYIKIAGCPKLKKLFGCRDRVKGFTMMKYLKKHMC